ncbi:MAG: redox-sensing transcriptional repressor Rex [Labilibaculum antarcticum]|uniref:Redox-sensing transcriptional repressor Rex n=1 Tax=Labilibaculum antarcticum TaxID=1717717 RepID=A0A1Y1CH11_9BACT|nr:redox-sensing transcriptional repressor Rex [Labilibaculum antarcticum]BAX79373.1 redox-sensing transcriptional repressor Rex [Labilibaculum antarcticum]
MVQSSKKIQGVPEPTIRRMPSYLAYAEGLLRKGQQFVSSTQIANYMNIDPTQVTKDLSYTAIVGKTRVGYEVKALVDVLSDFLGFTIMDNAFLVGAGSLGSALLHDSGLSHFGLNIVAAFDVNSSTIGKKINDIEVFHIDQFRDLSQEMNVIMGIITVPAENAQTVADLMVAWGIKAIWNFTPARIKVPEDIIVQNTTLYSNLAIIFNKLHSERKEAL